MKKNSLLDILCLIGTTVAVYLLCWQIEDTMDRLDRLEERVENLSKEHQKLNEDDLR